MARLTIYDRRERALVAVADALLWPVALRRAFRRARAARAAADSLLPARTHRRSADDAARRSPSCARSCPAPRSISWSAAGTATSRRRSRRRSCRDAGRRVADAGDGPAGLSPLGLALQAARVAIAALRSRDQLRARHPHEHRARRRRRAANRGVRERRRRRAARRRARLRRAAHTADNARRLVHVAVGREPDGAGARGRSASRRPPRGSGAAPGAARRARSRSGIHVERRARDQAVARDAVSRRRRTVSCAIAPRRSC